MEIRPAWLVLGVAAMAAAAWWATRESPEQARARQERADRAAAEIAEDARPVLYRWRDEAGVLHVADQPPAGRDYEIGRRPRYYPAASGREDAIVMALELLPEA